MKKAPPVELDERGLFHPFGGLSRGYSGRRP